MLPSSSQLSKNAHKSPPASSSILLLNSPLELSKPFYPSTRQEQSVMGAVRLFSNRGHCCFSTWVLKSSAPRWPRCRTSINISGFIHGCRQSLPLVRETLVKGLGTIFRSHTCQRPFSIRASMSPHAGHTEKRRRHGTQRRREKRDRDQEQHLQHVAANMNMTSVHQFMLQKKKKKKNPVATSDELMSTS